MFIKRFKNLSYFKNYYKKYIKLIISLIIVMLLASGIGVLISYLMSEQLIGITNQIAKQTIIFTVYILVAVTLHHINWFLWSKFAFLLTKKVALDIKKDFLKKFLNTKYDIIKNKTSGYYLERLNTDINEISSFVGNVAGTLVDVFTNFGFLIIIYILSWQLGLFFTIGVALLFIIESIKVKLDLKNLEAVKKFTEKTNSMFNELIKGVKDIKCFGLKNQIANNIQTINTELEENTYHKNTQFEFLSRIATYCQWIIDSILVFISILWLLPSGEITVIILLIIFNYKSLMYDTVGFFSKLKGYFINGDYYAGRVLEILDNNNLESFGTSNKVINKGYIELKNLSFNYDNNSVLKNINLIIKPNTITCLIGKSGSGKSTLFALLCKLYNTENGHIFYDGEDINNFTEEELYKNICTVNQEPFMFNDTLLNNIKIVKPTATNEEVYEACSLANIHNEIMALEKGYDTILTENGTNFSGGQKQRIEIARTILVNSKIILLDEPTSALDNQNQQKLLELLYKLKQNKTIIVIAHKLNDYTLFDNVIELNNGKITIKK